jgi:hypothetical protein
MDENQFEHRINRLLTIESFGNITAAANINYPSSPAVVVFGVHLSAQSALA